MLDLAAREYEERSGLERAEVRARFLAEVGYVTTRVGVDAAVFDDHDRILVVRRADDDRWGLVSGWCDPNESPVNTAVRELAEETGLHGRAERLAGVFHREARAGEHPHGFVSIVYLCSITGGELRAQPHEVREIAWRAVDGIAREEWHQHHEQLARAALDAHWRRMTGI